MNGVLFKLSSRGAAKIRDGRRLLEMHNKAHATRQQVARWRRTTVSHLVGWNQSSFSKECRDV
jgi:hypothetical protein